MIRQPISSRTWFLLGVISIGVLAMIYSWLSYRQHRINAKDSTMPNLSQFADGWKGILSRDRSGEVALVNDLFATYGRLLAGVLVGVSVSLVLGISMGAYAPAAAFFLPGLSFFAKIPPTAMLAVYLVALHSEQQIYVAMIALGMAATLAQTIYQAALKDVTDYNLHKAYTLGASHLEVIREVIWPQIFPRVLEAVRLQMGPAMVFLIAAEWALADVGIGYTLRMQSRLLNMNVVYTYLLILGAIGLLVDTLLTFARRKLCPWFGE